MACYTPVLATEVGGAADTVKDDNIGLMLESKSSQ
jgi:glycosyltransferase involved in cell wall biosynthesis